MSAIASPLLKGNSAIVTGGTTGIGRGIVLEYLRQGCSVVANTLGLEKDKIHKSSLLQEADEIHRQSQQQDGSLVAGKLVISTGDIQRPEYCSELVQEA